MVPNVARWLRQLSNSNGGCGRSIHNHGDDHGHGRGRGRGRGCGPRHHGHGPGMHGFFGGGGPGAGFGVRRPLRFLGHRLGLSDEQIGAFARILDDLKTERAQAAVDDRRSSASLADLLVGESFDDEAAAAIIETRVASAKRLAESVVKALREVHGVLAEGQRSKLATLIRGGVISL